jgi:uncharacterized membrane protein YcaP (DUF421 family)
MQEWIVTSWPDLAGALVSSLAIYVALIVYTRIMGMRSFSKMSSFDFALTIAIGSVVANVALMKSPPLLLGLVILAFLFGLQWAVANIRQHWDSGQKYLDNTPLLLMRGQEILDDNLMEANVTRAELFAKLREANVLTLSQVRAVVIETTGDVSVLHGDDESPEFDPVLLRDVRDAEGPDAQQGDGV